MSASIRLCGLMRSLANDVTRYGSVLGLSPKSRKALGVELIGVGAAAEPSAERSPYFDFD